MPAWLSFNAITKWFTGTPNNGDVESGNITVTAKDSSGLSVAGTFALSVTGVNDAPTVGHAIVDQGTLQDAAFSFQVPGNTFADVDAGDALTYSAMLADGHALPAWLSFDGTTQIFSGTPDSSDVGTMNMKVTATDIGGLNVDEVFGLTVIPTPSVVVTGTAGNDLITTGAGADVIDAMGGKDVVHAGAGNDVLTGGMGSDLLNGGAGDDQLQASIDGTWSSGVVAYNAGSPGHPGTGQRVAIKGKIRSFDVFNGGEGTDSLVGTSSDDALFLDDRYSPFPQAAGPRLSGIEVISTGDGDDIVDLTSSVFAYGNVTVNGGNGKDILWASGGNDVLIGGKGNDSLVGGAGSDTYQFSRGDGQDTIIDRDATSGSRDMVAFASGLNPSDLLLSRQVNNLRIAIHGSSDQITLQDWYKGTANQTETLQAGDGSQLVNTKVDQLIQAMATFSVSSGLTWDQAIDQRPEDVKTILAANWQ